jgi:hypothetical protein
MKTDLKGREDEGQDGKAPRDVGVDVVVETVSEEEEKMEIDEEEIWMTEAPQDVVVETVDEEEERIEIDEEEKGGMRSPETDPPHPEEMKAEQKEEWDRLARCELWERKATKSDDAAVPEYLWEEHLLRDGPTPWTISEADRPKLRSAMNLLRGRMLRWWKKGITTSFLVWTHDRYKGLRAMSSSALSWVQRQYATFSWTDSGKDEYRAWWKHRHFLAGRDLEPGGDAIARPARSSWWV